MMNRRIILSLLFCISVCSIHAQEYKPYHGDGVDDYLRFAPIVSVYVLKGAGVESKHSWKRLAVNTLSSLVLTTGTTYALKKMVKSERPDGTDEDSFPSGHTSFAFAGATLLCQEYGQKSPWIAVAGYTVATLTAVDRVRRNRHHWGDVLAGAAIGVGSAELGSLIGKLLVKDDERYQVSVSPAGLYVLVNL